MCSWYRENTEYVVGIYIPVSECFTLTRLARSILVEYEQLTFTLTLNSPPSMCRSEERNAQRRDVSFPGNNAAAAGELHPQRDGEASGHHGGRRERGNISASRPHLFSLSPSIWLRFGGRRGLPGKHESDTYCAAVQMRVPPAYEHTCGGWAGGAHKGQHE